VLRGWSPASLPPALMVREKGAALGFHGVRVLVKKMSEGVLG